jgi:DNA-binding GntR family transcriptional regulator
MRPISSTASAIAERLRERLVAGELKQGVPLRQERLAAEMGVSRLPIRDALSYLAAEGLVEIRPNRGAYVATLTRRQCLEIFDLRVLIECDALAHATPRHTPRSLRAIEAVQTELDLEDDTARWVEGDRWFHELLYAPSDRPLTLKTIRTLRNTVERFCVSNLHHDVRRVEWGAEHRVLLARVRTGDVVGARECLAAHLRATQAIVLDTMG